MTRFSRIASILAAFAVIQSLASCALLPPSVRLPFFGGQDKTESQADSTTSFTQSDNTLATKPADSANSGTSVSSVSASPTPVKADSLLTIRELRDAAVAAFDTNHPIEALRHLVGLLAVHEAEAAESDTARGAERAEIARWAETELTAIGARLTMETSDDWVVDGQQITGSTRDLAKGVGLRASVRLVVNYDFGKAVVADAPLRFGFIEGLGDIDAGATTDSYGAASATVRSVARTDKPVVIRAMLVISNKGKTKAFTEVYRDFTFLPPSRTARVFALERAASLAEPPRGLSPLVDAVSRGLGTTGLELLPTEGSVDPVVFMAALGGEPEAVKAALNLGGRPAAYLVAALAEYDDARQMVYQDKVYDIFTVDARVSVRLLRSDGSSVISRPQLSVRGQGGTASAAIQAALKLARDAAEQDLKKAAEAIKAALD